MEWFPPRSAVGMSAPSGHKRGPAANGLPISGAVQESTVDEQVFDFQ